MSGGSGQGRTGGRPSPGSCEYPGCRKRQQGAANATRATDPVEKWRGTRLCTTHYQRWYRYGDPAREPGPLGGARKRVPPAELIYMRHLVGLPADGPTQSQLQRWAREEASW